MTPRRPVLWSLPCVLALGLASKAYQGPGHIWIQAHAGGFFYVLFWVLLAAVIWIQVSPFRLAAVVFTVTYVLEILQLWHPRPLEILRGYAPGRLLVGTTFSWRDIPPYIVGSLVGALVVQWLRGKPRRAQESVSQERSS